MGKYLKCFVVYWLLYLLASFSCNLFYEVFYFFMIIPPFTFSWKAYNRPFIVGYFVVNYPVCAWQHHLLYVFTGCKSYFISAQSVLAYCRLDIKVALHNITYKAKTNLRNIYFSLTYCTGFFNSHLKVCWCFERFYYRNLLLFSPWKRLQFLFKVSLEKYDIH